MLFVITKEGIYKSYPAPSRFVIKPEGETFNLVDNKTNKIYGGYKSFFEAREIAEGIVFNQKGVSHGFSKS